MRVGYFSSRYPAISHTFIRREVQAMRGLGFDIATFTLRKADQVLSDEDVRERGTTWAILPRAPARILTDHAAALSRRPIAYLSTLQLAQRHRIAGARAWVWSLFHFAEAILLARELERENVEHLHVHFSNAGGTVGLLAAHYAGIDFSLTLHGSADFESPTRVLIPEKVAASRFTVCVSHYGRALAMRMTDPTHWEKLAVVRCGVELEQLPLRPAAPSNPRRRLLSVGRLSPEKGFVGLVEAFALACRQGVDAELVILGEGPERGRIEAAIERHGVRDRCELPGAASTTQVLAELARADAFAMSSFMEGLPVVLIEAMATGVPVVAPRVAGIPELIEEGRTGYLFTPGVWSELAARLQQMLAQPAGDADIVRRARQRVVDEFDVRRAAGVLAKLLQAPKESPR